MELKDRMNEELNNHNKRQNDLKTKFDDTSIQLRQTEDVLRDEENIHSDMNNKFNKNTDEFRNEIIMLKDEGERRRQQTDNLVRDNKTLDDTLIHLMSTRRTLEADLNALRKKHEYTVTDMNGVVSRIEGENVNL